MSDTPHERTEAEASAASSDQRLLQRVVDSLNEGIAVVDTQGRFVHVNEASIEITGVPPDDVPPEQWSQWVGVYKPDGKTLWPVDELPLVRAMRGEEVKATEMFIKNDARPEGIWISVSVSPLRDDAEAVIGAVCILHDITERRRAQQRLVRQRELLRDLLQQQERERSMVSHEIHDGFLQKIVGAKMVLEGVAGQVEESGPAERATLEQVVALLGRAMAEARQLVAELRPMMIETRTLAEAMNDLVHDSAYLRDVYVSLDYQAGDVALDGFAKGCVFRIVQEALTNVVKHSNSDTASLCLAVEDGMLAVEIEDQGCGFRLEDVAPDRFGLRGIRERARLLGGKAVITARPGQGTSIVVKLPI